MTDSSKHADALAEAWAEAQKKMWEGWTAGAGPTVQGVAERLFTGQDAILRLLEATAGAWRALAPKVESGEDWQTVLSKHGEQLRERLVQMPTGASQTAHDVAELWRLYLEEWQKLGQPWVEALRRAPGQLDQAAAGDRSELIDLAGLHWDAFERTFGRLLQSPSVGYSRELNEKLLRGFDAWVEFRRASGEYQAILGDVWVRAFEALMRELVARGERGEAVEGVQPLLRLWGEVLDRDIDEILRSEAYAKAQGRLLNAAMAYRIRERECVEAFFKMSHLPTRSELDDAYRTIYELRKELRALKKTLHQRGAGGETRAVAR